MNYILNTIGKGLKAIPKSTRKGITYTILLTSVLASSCSYDIADSWHRLRKRENKQVQRVEYEMGKLRKIKGEKTQFKKALEGMIKEIETSEEEKESQGDQN